MARTAPLVSPTSSSCTRDALIVVGDRVRELVSVLGQQVRVDVRPGQGIPLVLCNGIGASLEVLDPLVEQLDPDTTVVRFDVPGTGGSPNS